MIRVALFYSLIASIVVVSCRTITVSEKQESSTSVANKSSEVKPSSENNSWIGGSFKTMSSAIFNFTAEKPIKLSTRLTDGPSSSMEVKLADFYPSNCVQSKISDFQKWGLQFRSIFGMHKASIEIREQSAIVLIDDRKLVFNNFSPMTEEELSGYCERYQRGDIMEAFEANPKVTSKIKKWLSRIASDCSMRIEASNSWVCEFETEEAFLALSEVQSIHKLMVNRWNRQPYLFSRRLAITRLLAEALDSNAYEEKLDSFCKVVSFSMPTELPLSIASSLWFEVVCKNKSQNRMSIAQLGLSKALAEIDYLRLIFEQTSKLGVLAVRIPRTKVPSKDLWISLQPIMQSASSESVASGCWHPLFARSEKSLEIARKMDLLSEESGQSCDQAMPLGDQKPELLMPSAERYISASITSETEFVITNGQSKILRLPLGNYSYTIRPHSEALDELETDPNITPATGSLEWNNKRPHIVINNW